MKRKWRDGTKDTFLQRPNLESWSLSRRPLLPIIPRLDFLLSPLQEKQEKRREPEAELSIIRAINKKLQRSYN
ncbi:unnamed protein product [Brassica oleracea]